MAIVNQCIQNEPKGTRNIVMADALKKSKVESIFYNPIRKRKVTVRQESENQILSIFVSCWVPFFSNHRDVFDKRSLLFSRLIDFMEYFSYVLNIQRRLAQDKVDVYVFLHLWDSTIPLLSPLLYRFRPVAVMWMGHSLRWLNEFKLLYNFLLPVYKVVLKNCVLLTPIDVEQSFCLFDILKLPKNQVYEFNPCIVDEELFKTMDKENCAKIVGFDTTKFNILTIMAIRDPEMLDRSKSHDYQKDVFPWLQTYSYLAKAHPYLHLHILGEGEGMEKLRLAISDFGLEGKVTLHGWIPNEKCPLYINASDLVFNPCCLVQFNDATAIFEAFMCGKPVIAFKRYLWVSTEQTGGFLIDRNPKNGSKEIADRLNRDYLNKKAEETKRIPYQHAVIMGIWGTKLSEILKKVAKEQN